MINYMDIFSIAQGTLDSLHRANIILNPIAMNESTILMGKGAELDSLALVAFVSDIEEKVSDKTGVAITINLSDIEDFDINKPFVSMDMFLSYVIGLADR